MSNVFKNHTALLLLSENVQQLNTFITKESQPLFAFFSEGTIKSMIEEEAKRDTSIIIEREGQSLRSMSSGERKVAVLKYLLTKKPEVLVVENFYEHLDIVNKTVLENILYEYAKKAIVVQLVYRPKEVFSFIKHYYTIQREKLRPYHGELNAFFTEESATSFSIPATTTTYRYDYNNFVKLTDISVRFLDKPVLNKINWEIKFGEFWQLIGENGSGKTTLLSLITGDSHKAYGQDLVLFDKLKGTEENVWEIKQKIGYFTPNITELFNRRHSVLHMVLSGFYDSIGLYVTPSKWHIALAHEWLALIGMTSLANITFATLSESKQRMVLIARAMVKHPPLLILDEPTSGLDTASTQLIVALINKISIETKTTIIYVSHTMEKGLTPDKTYKLSKSNNGSTGNVL